jgi:hypothetical protein
MSSFTGRASTNNNREKRIEIFAGRPPFEKGGFPVPFSGKLYKGREMVFLSFRG